MLARIKRLLEEKKHREAIKEIDRLELSSAKLEAAAGVYRTEAMIALGMYDAAYVDRALDYLRGTVDFELFALAKYLRARLLIVTGTLLDAKEELTEAYVYYKRLGNVRGMARTVNLQSYIAYQQADYASFFEYADRCLKHYSSLGNTGKVVIVLLNTALTYVRTGQFIRAAEKVDRIRASYLNTLTDDYKYNLHHIAALLNIQKGQWQMAEQSLGCADRLSKDFRREVFRHYEINAYACIEMGQFDEAKRHLVIADKMATEIASDSSLVSQIKRLFGDLYVATHKWCLAQKYATEALAVAEKINERLEIAACYRVFARVARHRSHDDKARRWYKKAIDLFNLIGARYELAVTRYLAATSGLYENGERQALLYLAREYFESEEVTHYVDKIDAVLNRNRPPHPVKNLTRGCPTIVVVNSKMREMIELAEHVARSEMTVLLTGATGTGKDLLAEYIHNCSGRSGRLVSFNAAAVQDTLVESELFGSARGAFTGSKDRPGLLEEADKGTFYLNEIADATPLLQAKLLEVLETRSVRRLGESKTRPVAFRLIAATNRDLQQRMRDNLFRPDLYHRLNEIHINLPPLSERTEDIPALVYHFLTLAGFDTANGNAHDIEHLGETLARYSWPGNVRQLQAEVNRMWLEAKGDVSIMVRLALECGEKSEHEQLLEVLEQTGGNRSKAAKLLGVSEGTIRYRLKKLRIPTTC